MTTTLTSTTINNKSSFMMDVIRDCSPTRPKLTKISERHPKMLLEQISVLRKTNELCDVIINVGASKIKAHKIILSASSPYFRAMFCSELAESKQQEVTIKDIDEYAMEILIDYCYTSKITVDEKSVQTVLPAACLLQLYEVQDYCSEFLRSQLDPSNCLGIRAFADTHSCSELLRIADNYMQENFIHVTEEDEFLLLPLTQLLGIISNDELNIRNEEQVYQAVMNWVKHDISERKQYLGQLLTHVRLPLLDTKFLVTKVGNDPLIKQDQTCRDLIDEAKDYHLLPQERSLNQSARTKPRKPIITGEVLFAVGGWCSGDAISSAEMYDPQTSNEWKTVAPMSKRRCGVGVGVLNQQIYAIGGHDGQSYLNSVERFDPITNQWHSDVAPTTTRTSVGVAVLDDYLYAVGGQDGVSCLNIVEKYDYRLNKWSKVASMSSKRLGLSLVVCNGMLYAIGGSDGQIPLNTVERYDPKTNKWVQVSPMLTRRKHLGCAVFKNYIYAVGGRDDISELNSAERYNPSTNQWQPVVSMKSKRSGVGLSVINGNLMAIGGFDGTSYLKSVEIYDAESNAWKINSSMIYRRLGGGVGTIKLHKDSVLYNLTPNILNNTTNNHSPLTTSQSHSGVQCQHVPQRQLTSAISTTNYISSNSNTINTSNTNNNSNTNSWPFILSPVPSLLANVPQNNVSSLISYNSNRPLPSAPPTAIATITDSVLSDFNNLNIQNTSEGTIRSNANLNQTPIAENYHGNNNDSNGDSNMTSTNLNNRLLDI